MGGWLAGRRDAFIAALVILGIATTAHLLYSALGFNPTDDGFVLAYARRLLDGQMPHRDFITIRPALFAALHVPELLLGGDYTFWLSRFVVFLQLACIAWFGMAFVDGRLELGLSSVDRGVFSLISFTLCLHYFPAMAWYTLDGLFLSTLGLYFRSRSSSRYTYVAYFLMGLAYLCKQSFFPVAPAALLLFGDWRQWRCLASAALPGVLYVVLLVSSGGMVDGVQQMLSQKQFFRVGVYCYLRSSVFAGLAVGAIAAVLLSGATSGGTASRGVLRQGVGAAMIVALFVLSTMGLFTQELFRVSFVLFGAVCGAIAHSAWRPREGRYREAQTGAAVALVAWAASLSIGYNYPVCGSGLLVQFLLGLAYPVFSRVGARERSLALLMASVLALAAFHYARTHYIYRDLPASELTEPLGDVFPGGRLLRTNPNTRAFLSDLDSAIALVTRKGMRHAIVPSIAGYWARSQQKNPLPIDWAQITELNTPELLGRVTSEIEAQRSRQMVIVQKVRAGKLHNGFVEIEAGDPYYAVVHYVRSHLDKVDETRFFDIYQ